MACPGRNPAKVHGPGSAGFSVVLVLQLVDIRSLVDCASPMLPIMRVSLLDYSRSICRSIGFLASEFEMCLAHSRLVREPWSGHVSRHMSRLAEDVEAVGS